MLSRRWNPLTYLFLLVCSFRSMPLNPTLLYPPKRENAACGKAFRCPSSLTAECALILPLFLMAVLIMLSSIDLPGDLVAENLKLSNRARALASYAGTAGSEDSAALWIDLTSSVKPRISFSAIPHIRVRAEARARVRSWVGFRASDFSGEGDSGSSGETVYVTDYESVYHTHADCTHLDLTVIRSDTESVGSLRNVYGKRYKKCDGFPSGYHGEVYVTAKGDYYYPSPDYGSLSRHVHIVSSEETDGLPLCSRCAERDHAA